MAELVQFKDDGSVVLALSSGRLVLRRPTVGQVRKVQDATIAASDAAADAIDDHEQRVAEAADEAGVEVTDPNAVAAGHVLAGWAVLSTLLPADVVQGRTEELSGWVAEATDAAPADEDQIEAAESREWRRTVRDLNRRFNRDQQTAWFDVGRLVVSELGKSGGLPDDDDDLDPLFGSAGFYTSLIKHWTTRPLG